MAVIQISTYFGNVVAKPMRLVDIHDVCIANEENIQNSCESNSNNTTTSEVATKPTPSAQEDSSIITESTTLTDKQ